MSPTEFRPLTPWDIAARAKRVPASSAPPAAALPLDYAANPDRAWTPSPEQIRLEARRLTFKSWSITLTSALLDYGVTTTTPAYRGGYGTPTTGR